MIINKIIGNKTFNANKDILNDIKKFQLLRMPSVNGENKTINLKYNIPKYMFHCTGLNPKKIKKKLLKLALLIVRIIMTIIFNSSKKKLYEQEKVIKLKMILIMMLMN